MSNKLNEILEELEECGFDETAYFVNEDYADAIIGISTDGNLIYDYEKMVEYLQDVDGISPEDAIEWIEYNVVRTIPYMGKGHPILMQHLLSVDR